MILGTVHVRILRLTLVLGGVLGLGMVISSPLTSTPRSSGESLALGAPSGGHVAIDSITSAQPFVAIAKHARAAVVNISSVRKHKKQIRTPIPY